MTPKALFRKGSNFCNFENKNLFIIFISYQVVTIFNHQNNELLLTHYCGLQNKPVSVLESNTNGTYVFVTDSKRSGLSTDKEAFVTSWKLDLMPEDPNKISYQYTVSGPEGVVFVATAVMTRA